MVKVTKRPVPSHVEAGTMDIGSPCTSPGASTIRMVPVVFQPSGKSLMSNSRVLKSFPSLRIQTVGMPPSSLTIHGPSIP